MMFSSQVQVVVCLREGYSEHRPIKFNNLSFRKHAMLTKMSKYINTKPLFLPHPPEDEPITVNHKTRRDTSQDLPGSLVQRLPAFVSRIGVINRAGSLLTLAVGGKDKSEPVNQTKLFEHIGGKRDISSIASAIECGNNDEKEVSVSEYHLRHFVLDIKDDFNGEKKYLETYTAKGTTMPSNFETDSNNNIRNEQHRISRRRLVTTFHQMMSGQDINLNTNKSVGLGRKIESVHERPLARIFAELHSVTPREKEEIISNQIPPLGSFHPIHNLTHRDIEKAMLDRSNHNNFEFEDSGEESRIICYLASVILAILVLIAVIVTLTMMVTNKEMDF